MDKVRVLLDPADDMQVSVGLLERHDPVRGRVVVHPTPGTSSLQAFARPGDRLHPHSSSAMLFVSR